MCEIPSRLLYGVASCMIEIKGLPCLLKTLERQIFSQMSYSSLSQKKPMILNKKKKVQLCLNKTVLHLFSTLKCEMSCLLYFLIVGLEQAEQQRGCHEVQNSYQWVLSVGLIKYFLNAEKSRDLSQRQSFWKCFNEHSKKLIFSR